MGRSLSPRDHNMICRFFLQRHLTTPPLLLQSQSLCSVDKSKDFSDQQRMSFKQITNSVRCLLT
ncbi:unnamed protein product, partial [Arabidopsis halleri]